jgi:hypothetical protein
VAAVECEEAERGEPMAALGMPSDAHWVHVRHGFDGRATVTWRLWGGPMRAELTLRGPDAPKEWADGAGYEVELFGRRLPTSPWPPDGPSHSIGNERTGGRWFGAQLWQQAVRYSGSPLYIAVRRSPTHGEHVSMEGLEHSWAKEEVERARKGLIILREEQRKAGAGRKPDSIEYYDSVEELREANARVLAELKREGRVPTYELMASRLKGMSTSAYYGHIKEGRLPPLPDGRRRRRRPLRRYSE